MAKEEGERRITMEVLLCILGIVAGCGCIYFLLYMLKSLVEPTVIRKKGEEGYIVVHGSMIKLVLPKPKPGTRNPFLDEEGNLLLGIARPGKEQD